MKMDEISRIRSILEQQEKPEQSKRTEGEKASFRETLENFVNEVNELQRSAEDATQNLVTGDVQNIHQVMLAMNEADTSFRLMMEMRNKILEAYREIMRMQI